MLRPLAFTLALLIAPIFSHAATNDISSQIQFPVEKYTLPNGLTVLLAEDHSVPLISYQTWFRVGSKDEEPGFTGLAHLFEHMMFKGAKRYTGEQFDQLLQLNGATNNAFTTYDYTGYYENLPAGKLELIVDIESDRMQNLQVTDENLKSEREVVKEERRFRVDNSPQGILHETLYGTAYKVHPYRWPVIGYMQDINNITQAKAADFFRQYYAPNNAVIVVSGDFKSSEAKRLIEKFYGSIPSQEIKRRPRQPEPAMTSGRSQLIQRDVQNVSLSVAYHVPKAGDDDVYALDLMANILARGNSSRLYKRLVYKEQRAGAVGAFNYSKQDSGLFEINVAMKPGQNWSAAQKAIYGEIYRFRTWLVTPAELQTAKNQTMKDYVDGLKTAHGRAEALEINEILFGDYTRLFTDLGRYNAVTPEMIKAVAKKYFAPEKSVLTVLKPKKMQ